MKTRESRTELLIKGLTLRHKRVTLFDKNPQSTRNNDPDTKVEKIIIKDLPLSMGNAEIGDFFKQMKHVVLTSQIRDACMSVTIKVNSHTSRTATGLCMLHILYHHL